MRRFRRTNLVRKTKVNLSPNMNNAFSLLKGLSKSSSYEKILNDLMNLAAWQQHPTSEENPLAQYSAKEQQTLLFIYKSIQESIAQRSRVLRAKTLTTIPQLSLMYDKKLNLADCPSVHNSKESYHLLRDNWNAQINYVEDCYILLIGANYRVKGMYHVSKGGTSTTTIDFKVIFAAAVSGGAEFIIFAHNHPGGNLQPSQADIKTTATLVKAGAIMHIPIFDHLIISSKGYYSFADAGLITNRYSRNNQGERRR